MDDGIYTGKYIGKSLLGFEYNHEYTFKLCHPPNSCYELQELEDNLFITYASEISIKQYWIIENSDTESEIKFEPMVTKKKRGRPKKVVDKSKIV